jgi:rod shape-determining protein MreC
MLLGHIVLISTQVTTKRGVPLFEAAVFGAFAEVQRGIAAAGGQVQSAYRNYVDLRGVRTENAQLRAELDAVKVRLQQEQALANETRSLQRVLDLRQRVPLTTVAAALIAGSASPDFRTITIDSGTRRGLANDMAVVAPGGVVGRVIQAGVLASKVQLLIDRNAAVGIVDERSRAQGIAVGTGTGTLALQYVSGTADVKVGDMIVTSGIDGIYPKGFVVGQLESVQRGAGEYSQVRVRPAVDFSSLAAELPEVAAGTGQAPE